MNFHESMHRKYVRPIVRGIREIAYFVGFLAIWTFWTALISTILMTVVPIIGVFAPLPAAVLAFIVLYLCGRRKHGARNLKTAIRGVEAASKTIFGR